MTTVTGPGRTDRIDALRAVPAAVRGLSLEPLWERIASDALDLSGIDWLIAGGESGRAEFVRPFEIEWAEELLCRCRDRGVAFFLKQLGRKPMHRGAVLGLRDTHGGDWTEWPEHLRIREVPEYFREYGRTRR